MNANTSLATLETTQTVEVDSNADIARVNQVQALASPSAIKQAFPLSVSGQAQVRQHKQAIKEALSARSTQPQKFIIITGPCSLHDEVAALDYGKRLAALNEKLSDKLLIVMRAYVEKPRTTTGWKGLAYDPERNGRGDIALGIERSRSVMLKLIEIGLPIATEALSPMTMNYLDDLISWTAIGARTAESQIHREMISHLGMPVGIKNGTDGSIETAVNAMISASRPHHCLGMNQDGHIAMLDTMGNPDTHVVLRGGRGVTNYDAKSIAQTIKSLEAAQQHDLLHAKVIVDCSHDNAQKNHENQIKIAEHVVEQHTQGNRSIAGIMLESFLEPGKQDISGCNGDGCLKYGLSVTDPCLGWEQTESLLVRLHRLL